MNSHWKRNLIIFVMTLVPTNFGNRIKIRFLGRFWESNSGQTWSKLTKIFDNLRFDVKTWKMLFWDGFDQFLPLVNPGLTKGILVIFT